MGLLCARWTPTTGFRMWRMSKAFPRRLKSLDKRLIMNFECLIFNGRNLFSRLVFCRSWCLGVLVLHMASALPLLADQDALSAPVPEDTPHLSFPKPPPKET